jgi:transcriptional regulator with PAS, ATPase and Fis domain
MARERAIANQLAQLLGASNSPIYAVDARRRIVFCNVACADWLGVTVEELIGQRCDYAATDSGDRVVDLAAKLCPPPEAFLGQLPVSSVQIAGGIDDGAPRLAECISLSGGDGECVGVFVILRDADEDLDSVSQYVACSEDARRLHLRLQQLVTELRMPYRLERLVGESLAIRLVREQVRVAIETRANVQVIGPAGSGREHIGRTIHGGRQPEQAGPSCIERLGQIQLIPRPCCCWMSIN